MKAGMTQVMVEMAVEINAGFDRKMAELQWVMGENELLIQLHAKARAVKGVQAFYRPCSRGTRR